MRINRMLLRNYRVFADELELEVPPGLVGIYGPNGSGKSCLVGSVPWALFGYSRTGNDEVRTSGVDAESLAEVELEHEGHLYVVRRTVSGMNHTVRAQAHADGVHVADGVRDTTRYVRSVLGIDDAAFRASVFAEQNQLAAFSGATPAKRRDLVLKLLGITPIDSARDRARRDAKVARDDLERLRGLLPDLEALATANEQARAAAQHAEEAARGAGEALAERRRQLGRARRAHDELTVRSAEHEALLSEGREVRLHHDAIGRRVDELEAELAGLAEARHRMAGLTERAAGLAATETRLLAVQEVHRVERALEVLPLDTGPPEADEVAHEQARRAAEEARGTLVTHRALLEQARRQREQAATVVNEATRLSGEADCPLCGQGLGTAFEQVQAHRQRELVHAETNLATLVADESALAERARTTLAHAREAAQCLEHARQMQRAWDEKRASRAATEGRLADLLAGLAPPLQPGEGSVLADEVERRRQAAAEVQRLQGRLERAIQARTELEARRHDFDLAAGRLDTLRDKVRCLGFSRDDLAVARQSLELAEQAQDQADRSARTAELEGARTAAQAESAERILEAARQQHGRLEELTEAARHLGRLADLLSAFRNQLVGAVGPRLSRQAASLFAELTDAEYDELRVDPETYGINIVDQGVAYGMDRFSGSETDLASLALRVAISEHLCFQSGGQIGLLVLDEVFGPLDADRSDRMLRALERLKARFRQVLVVTHDREIKDQLPTAIEVRKLPGRRATAQIIGMS